jgi:hypothetical protein
MLFNFNMMKPMCPIFLTLGALCSDGFVTFVWKRGSRSAGSEELAYYPAVHSFARAAVWSVALLSAACASPRVGGVAPGACPAAGETADDCPWAAVGRALAAEARAKGDVATALETLAPELVAAADADAKRPELLALWGTSLNEDELAHAEILAPPILDALNARAHAPPRDGNKTHAGVEHTYGYLLSTLRTPFGFKRARWVKPELELGFALDKGALGPRPPVGTLLTNATYFAGRVAFRTDARARASLERFVGAVDPSIARVAFEQLAVTRLTEALTIDGRTVVLRTDFVPFPRAVPGGTSTHLLVYSVADSSAEGVRLVTAFPVGKAFVQKALAPTELGEAMPIPTRYNAFVPGVTGQEPPLRGRRGADGPAPE